MARVYVCIDVYTVKAGDTLYSIARMYDVPVNLLMQVNRVRNPYNLRIGTRLCIPGMRPNADEADGRGGGGTEGSGGGSGSGGSGGTGEPACSNLTHTVKEGDTLYMIAKMHKVTLDALMAANPDIDPYNLQIGMVLCVPQG